MSDVLLVHKQEPSYLMVPVEAVKADLVTKTGTIIYVPLASTTHPGIVQVGEGLLISGEGLLSLDRSEITIKSISKNGSLIAPDENKNVNIELSKADVGLNHVDNTSDIDKPVSTAQQAALDTKFDKYQGTDNFDKGVVVGADGYLKLSNNIGGRVQTYYDDEEYLDKTEIYNFSTNFDLTKSGRQVNVDVAASLLAEIDSKVDKVEGKALSTNDLTDELKSAYDDANSKKHEHSNKSILDEITAAYTIAEQTLLAGLSTRVTDIELLIPAQATTSNQLADKDFVNSTVTTATATFRGTYNVVSDLNLEYDATESAIATALASEITTADNNDYCFVQIPTSTSTPTEIARIDRYKYVAVSGGSDYWDYEFSLNNSGFTAAQWAAINSGITAAKVLEIDSKANDNTVVHLTGAETITGKKTIRAELEFQQSSDSGETTKLIIKNDNGYNAKIKMGNTENMRLMTSGTFFGATAGPITDNATDLGASNTRWKDLYLSGGANFYNTSASGSASWQLAEDIYGQLALTRTYNNTATKMIEFNGNSIKPVGSSGNLGSSTQKWASVITDKIDFGDDATITKDSSNRINLNYSNDAKIKVGSAETIIKNRIGADSDNSQDIGRSTVRWKDLYLAGKLTDGTNEVTIPNIVTKNTEQTITGLKTFATIPKIKSLGLNLFTGPYTLTQSSLLNATGGLDTTTGYATTDYLDILESGKSYDVEFSLGSGVVNSIYSRICFYDENKDWLSNEDDFNETYSEAGVYHRTITMPDDAVYIRYSINIHAYNILIKETDVLANAVNENDVDNKLANKVDAKNLYDIVYGTDYNGQQTQIRYTTSLGSAGNIVARHNDGQIFVPQTPTENGHAASKYYIDSNFVSFTDSTQTLDSDQQALVRSKIGAGSSTFSGSYIDLSNKPTINTNNSSSLSVDSAEILSSSISLHKISKTGKLADTIKDSSNRVVTDDEKTIWNDLYSNQLVSSHTPKQWIDKTWSGLTDFQGYYVWTDDENIYYSKNTEQYKLNKLTDTWEAMTWTGLTSFFGHKVWKYGDHIYYSDGSSQQYELNKATHTWSAKTWSGLPINYSLFGEDIWIDNRFNYVYVSNGTQTHYRLDPATLTWSSVSFSNLNSFYGNEVWFDGKHLRCQNYYLKPNTYTSWTWCGGARDRNMMWNDGTRWYCSVSNSKTLYVYNPKTKYWNDESFTNNLIFDLNGYPQYSIWTDGEHIYYSFGTVQYVLNIPKLTTPQLYVNSKLDANNIDWIKPILKNLKDSKQDVITSTNKLDYDLLSNTPTIPTKTSDLTNDGDGTSNFARLSDLPSVPVTDVQLNGSSVVSSGVANVKALPNYSLSIGSTNGGNPRQVKFLSVNYTNYDGNNACFIKLGAMCSHGNGASYTFMDDIFIGVSSTGSVICNVYKYFQQETTLDGVTRNYGDVFYTIDTTNKVVDFYILLGQYSTANFTPYTKIGATTTTGITQYSGTPTYYSSGTKNWATGNSTTYARKNDIPTDYVQKTTDALKIYGTNSSGAQITFGYDISPTQDSGGLVSSGGVYSALLNKANSNLSNVTYPANTIGSTTSGSGDRVIQTYIQTDLHLMYRIWQSGFKEVFGNGSIGETSKITRSLGVSFTSTSTMYIVVSNASGKTSGNTEGVMTGSPKSASEIYISSGYLDPNTSSYHFYVFGF